MTRKTTTYARKRAHGARQADPLYLRRTIGMAQQFEPAEVTALMLPASVALEAMRTGRGTQDDFDTLAQVVNVALVRCEQIGQPGVELCKDGQAALMRMLARHQRTHRWGVDHQDLRDLPPALDLYHQLLQLSTAGQMATAMREVLQRAAAGQFHEITQP